MGFLLCLIFAIPAVTHAQTPPAISPYVQQVLARVEANVNPPRSFTLLSFIELQAPSELRTLVSTAVVTLVDTRLRVVEQSRSLQEQTACLRFDLYLLEREMKKIRGLLWEAWERKSLTVIHQRLRLLQFLNAKYRVILDGRLDPAYQDKRWYEQERFEPPPAAGWCCRVAGSSCAASTPASCGQGGYRTVSYSDSQTMCAENGCVPGPTMAQTEPPQCPFASDYLPPSMGGYGCDVEAIQAALQRLPGDSEFDPLRRTMEAELDALWPIQVAAATYQQEAVAYARVNEELRQLLRGGAAGSAPGGTVLEPRKHKTVNGCSALEDGMVLRELRGRFSLEKDQARVTQSFETLRRAQGESRPASDEFLWPIVNGNEFARIIAMQGAAVTKQFSADQGTAEALTFAVGSDPALTVADALAPFSLGIGRLSKLGSELTGVRSFVRDFAFYLLRSCTDRPCKERLERIFRFSVTDECFPYVSGDYKDDLEDYPRWQQCMDAAGVNR